MLDTPNKTGHFEDQEDASDAACYQAARNAGVQTAEAADHCDDGLNKGETE